MVVAFFGSTILAVVLLRFLPVFFTPLMFIRMHEQLQEGRELKLSHSWVSLEKMSPSMPVAVFDDINDDDPREEDYDCGAYMHVDDYNELRNSIKK